MKAKYAGACIAFLESRIANLNSEINRIKEARFEETKSSAGDKYETSREMMKQEEDKAIASLQVFEKQLNALHRLDLSAKSTSIQAGSLVLTDRGTFFVTEAIGKVCIENDEFFAISTVAPLFKVFQNKKEGDKVSLNGIEYLIKAVY